MNPIESFDLGESIELDANQNKDSNLQNEVALADKNLTRFNETADDRKQTKSEQKVEILDRPRSTSITHLNNQAHLQLDKPKSEFSSNFCNIINRISIQLINPN